MNRRHPLSFLLAIALPFAGIAVTAAPAFAQTPPPAAAAAAPVTVDGRLARFVLSPRGHVVALVLTDTTVVHVAPREADGAVAALKPGAALHVEGKLHQTPTGNIITHAVVQHDGKVIADGSKAHRRGHHGHQRREGARGDKPQLAPMSVTARVTQVLAGPKGRVHTVLLDDGTTATGFGLETLGLKSGDRVTVNGKGGAYPLGKAVHIDTITLPNGETRTLPHPAPRQHPRRQQQQQPV
jgi:hypothetical protein